MIATEIARLVESSEARAYYALVTGAPVSLRARHGLRVARIGGAYVFMGSGVGESLLLNRVIGLGVFEPLTPGLVNELDGQYVASGIGAYAVELSPVVVTGMAVEELQRMGFVPFKQTTMMHRATAPLPEAASELAVRCVGAEYANCFAELCCSVFGFADPLPALLRASFQHSHWQHWLAFDGDVPVAAAITVHFEDGVAWIGWVCTLASHRGRGAQSALAVAQLRACHERGVHVVTLEAATGTRRRPSQSLQNYLRLGWTSAYDRMVLLRRVAA